jgi:hypothetical protein
VGLDSPAEALQGTGIWVAEWLHKVVARNGAEPASPGTTGGTGQGRDGGGGGARVNGYCAPGVTFESASTGQIGGTECTELACRDFETFPYRRWELTRMMAAG